MENFKEADNNLKNALNKVYGNSSFVPLCMVDGIDINRFSNVTIGKDEVEYMLVNAKDMTEEGTISIHDETKSHRRRGSIKGVKKYELHIGDVVFPQKRRFKSIGVMMIATKVPYVGHHGLMRVSCGEDNLDLAFFIREYLLLESVSDYIAKCFDNQEKLIDIIGRLPIPKRLLNNIDGYSVRALNIKYIEKELAQLQTNIESLSEKQRTCFKHGKYIAEGSGKILKSLKKLQKQLNELLILCDNTEL